MDYCSHVYNTVSSSNLKILDRIQNKCLRLALRARHINPVISLEVETNIPPLFIRRKFLSLKYHNKILDSMAASPIVNECRRDIGNTVCTSISMVQEMYRELNIIRVAQANGSNVSCIPPWNEILENGISVLLHNENIAGLSALEIQALYQEIVSTRYPNHKIF